MARQTPLGTVRNMLMIELGMDTTVANTALNGELNQILADEQNWLASEYDWPFLLHRWSVNCPIRQQFNPFPTTDDEAENFTINFDRPYYFEVFYVQKWEPVDYGIGSEEYNIYNSYLGEANDPIQRWQFHDEGGFEVWPLPVSAQTIRFTGCRNVQSLLTNGAFDDTKTFDLDDLLVVYFCAAKRLARLKQEDAGAYLELAQRRLQVVRATYPSRDRKLIYGNDRYQGAVKRVIPLVTVHG